TKIGAHEIWGGVPAKFIKKTSPGQAESFGAHYVEYSKWYLEEDGNWHPSKETGDRFQKHLADMADALMAAIPEIGLFYFCKPDTAHKEADLTIHCICAGSGAFTVSEEGITVAQWMEKGVNGEMLKLGLEHLR
ncbi:MAG: hypothetical protein IKG55_04835, partial [Solobacterium sp.]|nr:hypothetical protein [Solobacterium sp.]